MPIIIALRRLRQEDCRFSQGWALSTDLVWEKEKQRRLMSL
jgi:hypothetical protein